MPDTPIVGTPHRVPMGDRNAARTERPGVTAGESLAARLIAGTTVVNGVPQVPADARSENDGPLFHYSLTVDYPNEGGRVTESGQIPGGALAKRLRDEADWIERASTPAVSAPSPTGGMKP